MGLSWPAAVRPMRGDTGAMPSEVATLRLEPASLTSTFTTETPRAPGRVPLLVCSVDGDIGCGQLTTALDVGAAEVTW